ncbi:hypothetical protein E4U54_004979, partial [Claviceps lovelessii]
ILKIKLFIKPIMKTAAAMLSLIFAVRTMAWKDYSCDHSLFHAVEPVACYDKDGRCTPGDCEAYLFWLDCLCPDSTTNVYCSQEC